MVWFLVFLLSVGGLPDTEIIPHFSPSGNAKILEALTGNGHRKREQALGMLSFLCQKFDTGYVFCCKFYLYSGKMRLVVVRRVA